MDCRQRKLTAWNVYQRQVYADMLNKHGKEAAFKMTAERLKSEDSKKEYKAQKASLAKLATEENKTIKICPKTLETGYVRDPATGRKRAIANLPPMDAARLGIHRKTGKEDGEPRWLYLVTNNGARVYSGSINAPSTTPNRAYWSKIPPREMQIASVSAGFKRKIGGRGLGKGPAQKRRIEKFLDVDFSKFSNEDQKDIKWAVGKAKGKQFNDLARDFYVNVMNSIYDDQVSYPLEIANNSIVVTVQYNGIWYVVMSVLLKVPEKPKKTFNILSVTLEKADDENQEKRKDSY
jgi:hypothetical protein